jgi:homospermidine synthase
VPDDLPHDFVLNFSKPYLGEFLSLSSDWNPLQHQTNVFHGFNRPHGDPADPWQFKNFLITEDD